MFEKYAHDQVRDHPKETWTSYAQGILDQAIKANKRLHYWAVWARLSDLVRMVGGDEAMQVFRILWEHHKSQPAFRDELERFVDDGERRIRHR